jgi:nicotinamide phosphoribosyltransferase
MQIKGAHGMSKLFLKDQCTVVEEEQGLLQTVFLDGELFNRQTLSEIRARLNSYKL